MAANPNPQIQPDHEIQIRLVQGPNGLRAVPDKAVAMTVGQTVRYSSPDGTVTITYDGPAGSPFLDASGQPKPVVTDSDGMLVLHREGDFSCRCSITLRPPNVGTFGWPDDPQSGDEQHVGH